MKKIKPHSIKASTPDCLSEGTGSIPVGVVWNNVTLTANENFLVKILS